MTFEDKAAIVISQLRKDRDRLQHNIEQIRAEIVELPTISINANDVYKAQVLQIIDKYKEDKEFDKEYGEI